MAQSKNPTPDTFSEDESGRFSFDVMMETSIGKVTIGEGDLNAHEAAMVLIARRAEPGVFTFPGHDEAQTVRVEVRYVEDGVPDLDELSAPQLRALGHKIRRLLASKRG